MILTFKILPISGGFTAQIIKCDYSGLNFTLDNDNAKGKFLVSGSINILDYDFFIDEVIEAANGYTIECYGAGETFFEVDFKTVEITNNNESLKNVTISFEAETSYLSDEWANFNKKYNIQSLAYETNDLYYNNQKPVAYYGSNPVSFTGEDLTACDLSALALSGWDIHSFNITSHSGSGPYLYTGTVNYKRKEAYGFYVDTDKYDPDGELYSFGTGTYIYISDVVIGDITYPFYRVNITPDYSCSGDAEPFAGPYTNDADYTEGDVEIEYTGVTRKVTDVIEFLFTEMGLTSIAFDSGGTATDSFYSFKTMEGESMTKGSTTTNKLYSHLLIMNLIDFIPTDAYEQNGMRFRANNVSLESILYPFIEMGFEWFLQNRLGTYYFILRYKEYKSLGSSNPDLTDYKGHNWLRYADVYEKEPPEYHRIVNERTAHGIDFKNIDIIFTKVYGNNATKALTDINVFVDLDDIATRRGDVYELYDNDNIVIIAAVQDGSTKDYVRNPDGLLSQIARNNCELGFAYLGKNIYCDYPHEIFEIAGTEYTADNFRLKKRSTSVFKIPIDNIKTDFDVSDEVNGYEIEDITQNANDEICTLKLKK